MIDCPNIENIAKAQLLVTFVRLKLKIEDEIWGQVKEAIIWRAFAYKSMWALSGLISTIKTVKMKPKQEANFIIGLHSKLQHKPISELIK